VDLNRRSLRRKRTSIEVERGQCNLPRSFPGGQPSAATSQHEAQNRAFVLADSRNGGLLYVLPVLLATLWTAYCIRRLYVDTVHTDFSVLYASGLSLRRGLQPYVVGPGGCNLNPPLVLPLLALLAAMPYAVAISAHMSVSILALIAAMVVVYRELNTKVDWRSLVAAGLFMGTLQMLREGNLAWLLTLPAALAWRAARHDRWIEAALWLGLLMTIKPIFGWFVFALVLRRHWAAAFIAGGVALGGALLGILLFGLDVTRQWLAVGAAVTWFGVDTNVSLLSILTRAFPNGHFGSAYLGLSIFVLMASAFAICQTEENVDRDWSIVWLVSLLIAPLGWVYYYWLAAGPLLALFRGQRSPVLVLAALGLCAHSLNPAQPVAIGPGLVGLTLGSSFFWSTVVFWAEAMRQPPPRRAAIALAAS
jgi:hypothetical protein